MRIAIHQPHYLPWLGYFDKIRQVDKFVFLDDVEFSKGDYQNRCVVPTGNGNQYLTVPVIHQERQLISDVEIANHHRWIRKHLRTLEMNFQKLPYFSEIWSIVDKVLGLGPATSEFPWTLVGLNIRLIIDILDFLQIKDTELLLSSDIKEAKGKKTQKILSICQALGADEYLSGQGAKDYLETEAMQTAGIKVLWQDYKPPDPYSVVYHMMKRGKEIWM